MRIFLFLIVVLLTAACSRPVSKFSYKVENNIAPAEIVFENESKNAETYQWDFGNGKRSELENPGTTYLLSGRYDVSLIATKGNKKNSSKQTIVVNPPEKCLILIETSMGNMLVELFEDTPQHRENFTELVEKGYYEDLLLEILKDSHTKISIDTTYKIAKGVGAFSKEKSQWVSFLNFY